VARPGTFNPLRPNILDGRRSRRMMSESDEALIAGIVAGDREAFAGLYRRRRPDVYRFALHMTGSPAAAEDVAQDVFLAVIRDAGRYTAGRSGVVPWLLGIARNHALRRLTERRHEPLPEPGREPGIDADPAEGVARGQQIALLRAALVDLPVVFREAVVLCDLQELSYQEAADAAGCAVGTIRSRLHRGRGLLAAALKKEPWTETTPHSNGLSRTRFAR
jgi:RNA polymerase sigma-70 factor, ECF subfamily